MNCFTFLIFTLKFNKALVVAKSLAYKISSNGEKQFFSVKRIIKVHVYCTCRQLQARGYDSV